MYKQQTLQMTADIGKGLTITAVGIYKSNLTVPVARPHCFVFAMSLVGALDISRALIILMVANGAARHLIRLPR